MNSNIRYKCVVVICIAVVVAGFQTARAGITDFTTWTQVQDLANVNFTGSAIATQATLLAGNGAVPPATDIGYQSVNGQTPATSTSGNAFDPSASFSVAIDYNVSFSNSPTGTLAVGFGIGEDREGNNSAGMVMVTNNGSPFGAFAAQARIDDDNQSIHFTSLGATLSGSLFASYDAASGDVTLGASTTAGAASPTHTAESYTGIQNSWAGGSLLASFFMRSDGILGTPWASGNGQAVFSNFRVISGTSVAVPEPSSLTLLALSGLTFRRRSKHYPLK